MGVALLITLLAAPQVVTGGAQFVGQVVVGVITPDAPGSPDPEEKPKKPPDRPAFREEGLQFSSNSAGAAHCCLTGGHRRRGRGIRPASGAAATT